MYQCVCRVDVDVDVMLSGPGSFLHSPHGGSCGGLLT